MATLRDVPCGKTVKVKKLAGEGVTNGGTGIGKRRAHFLIDDLIRIAVDHENGDRIGQQGEFVPEIGLLYDCEAFVKRLDIECFRIHAGKFIRHGAGAQE